MQVKSPICAEGSPGDIETDECQKKTSCFSNIKIFLVSECALMLAQGTVGAYLVSYGHELTSLTPGELLQLRLLMAIICTFYI